MVVLGRTLATYTAPELPTDPVAWQVILPDAEGRTLLSETIHGHPNAGYGGENRTVTNVDAQGNRTVTVTNPAG